MSNRIIRSLLYPINPIFPINLGSDNAALGTSKTYGVISANDTVNKKIIKKPAFRRFFNYFFESFFN